MFTYLNDSTESDIEIMTRGPPNRISCTNQPSLTPDGETIPEASTNATLPDPVVWTDWNTYRLDWLPDRSTWYVNDVEMVTKTYGVPKRPSSFLMNVVSFNHTLHCDTLHGTDNILSGSGVMEANGAGT